MTFYGRLLGTIEFICPFCFRFQRVMSVNWRRPRAQCANKYCTKINAFGILASTRATFPSYQACRYDHETENHPNHNYIGHVPGSDPSIGHIIGPVEWWCPACAHRNLGKPTPALTLSTCARCKNELYFALVIIPTVKGRHIVTPPDWIPPHKEKFDVRLAEIDRRAVPNRPGEDSEGDRGPQYTLPAGYAPPTVANRPRGGISRDWSDSCQ